MDPMARKRGIHIKKSHQGRLRAKTKVKKGRKIPASKLRQMKRSKSAATRKQATFALNARRWNKGKRRKR
jgi:oligoendopeptidase F